MKRTTRHLVVFVGISLVVSVPFFIFLYRFLQRAFTSEVTDWSNMGSYLSGTSGVIAGLAQIFATGYVAFVLWAAERRQEARSERDRLNRDLNQLIRPVWTEVESVLSKDQYDRVGSLLVSWQAENIDKFTDELSETWKLIMDSLEQRIDHGYNKEANQEIFRLYLQFSRQWRSTM